MGRSVIIAGGVGLIFVAHAQALEQRSVASDPAGVAPEPWPLLNSGSFSGHAQPSSPDPLVSYVWPPSSFANDSTLQIHFLAAAAAGPSPTTPADSFLNASSAVGSVACSITVRGAGRLVIDFGVESPGWLEFDSSDLLPSDAKDIVMGTSEYSSGPDFVAGYKEAAPTVYGSNCGAGAGACTYRLETNSELYEGLRFGFITLAQAPSRPFTISAVRCVAQAKVVNYVSSFSSAGDALLERIWYSGAYTVRATLQSTYMGSILEDRGDRISWVSARVACSPSAAKRAHPDSVPCAPRPTTRS